MKRQTAASLVEVMVALFILSVGFAAFMTFQSDMFRSRGFSVQHSEAVNIAKDKIESLRQSASVGSIKNGTSIVNGKNATYSLGWVITSIAEPKYNEVSVTVGWKDASGNEQTVRLETLLAEPNHSGSASIKEGL